MVSISRTDLRTLCVKALSHAGLRAGDVDIIVDHYLENEESGKSSHGLVRVVEAAKVARKYGVPAQDPGIVNDTGNMVICDAKSQIGPVAGAYAMNLILSRTLEHGLAFCGIQNFIGNSGSMTYYLRRIVEAGLIGIMGCNSVALVAPPAGRKRMLGTNPFGIGIPSEDGRHFIADFATSAIAYGKIMVMKDQGKPVPEGMLIDASGQPSTNPKDAYDGAILPLADYRGFALGLMIELLAGPLIGAKACKQGLYDGDGFFMIGIDPAALGRNDFAAQIAATLEDLRASPPRPGFDAVTIPGDRADAHLETARKTGHLDVVDKTLENIRELAQ